MSREIKFRAWIRCGEWEDDGEKRKFKMIDGNDLAFEEYAPLCDLLIDDEDEKYFMQFTGLKDKNGKEVYEGDIMKVRQRTVGKGRLTKYKDFFIPVEFFNGAFILPFIDYGKYRFRDGDIKHFEVIGNIYENFDLLIKSLKK